MRVTHHIASYYSRRHLGARRSTLDRTGWVRLAVGMSRRLLVHGKFAEYRFFSASLSLLRVRTYTHTPDNHIIFDYENKSQIG